MTKISNIRKRQARVRDHIRKAECRLNGIDDWQSEQIRLLDRATSGDESARRKLVADIQRRADQRAIGANLEIDRAHEELATLDEEARNVRRIVRNNPGRWNVKNEKEEIE